ncbi:uncharacterized protein BT62DRAFT_945513 [Guyanagaster necrorhizus]|uniref:Uncharacterized protein n=1 Tax=Guyanagaster necrorhizus TaxID=856835 RepID=A0A9P7VZA9_9AGAR|nr:uncharacterized protein BT62DRAFT_945513 [Guyanagaster necrorhizus MCA 3950]KAG7449333.1 hypothetical protein BT62DRAFT_945513 [Guyanagaster necrorhizus MCA 3950]
MPGNQDALISLSSHPIFSLPKEFSGPLAQSESSLELSTTTLPKFRNDSATQDGPTASGRRQNMVLRDSDIIVTAGREIRMTQLGDGKISHSAEKQYKTLHTPNVQFEIHHMSLNPGGKLLAVAGASQVAVIVLPRSGFLRLVPDKLDCKSVQVGQYHHASNTSPPIAKIQWHPWGDAGTTLMVMTVDGKLREYDISVDAEDPLQVLSFVPDKKPGRSYLAEDPADREVASFDLGKGKADWGPLTVYAIMRSGDIYSICPYMPKNASIPSAYVHSLECFISAKLELLSRGSTSAASKNLSTIYDYQQKYVSALVKQLPAGSMFPATSRSVPMHPPSTIKASPTRQGPFLLQPSPRMLEHSDGDEATDITYLAFGNDFGSTEEDGGETEHLGVVMIAYQDGRVDLCLDVDKVEARWSNKSSRGLPMLAVYETIDLGLVSNLWPLSPQLLDLLQANHPVFVVDPIYDDTIYVYHAFGVHALHLQPVLQSLASALRANDDDADSTLAEALQQSTITNVQPILSTFSVEKKCSNPVVAVTIPDNVYLTYSIFILTSAMRITTFNLVLRSESPRSRAESLPPVADDGNEVKEKDKWLKPTEGPSAYVSLLRTEPFQPGAILSHPSGLPSNPQLSLPPSASSELMLTPEILRYLANTVAELTNQIREIQLAHRRSETRAVLQVQELKRLCEKAAELNALVEKMKGPDVDANKARIQTVQETHKNLMARLDRMLQHMMDNASPELSEHETKWFEELKRMKQEVTGIGRYDGSSLAARAGMMQREYDRVLPDLKSLLEKEQSWKAKHTQNCQTLGISQAFEFGKRSTFEQTRISQLENDVSQLATTLDIAFSKPPDAER